MNKLEETMGRMNHIQQDIEAIIYAIGDSARKFTEDELLNMLIGMSELHKARYEMMWQDYQFSKNKNVDKSNFPNYDDGTMAMKVTNSEGEVE
tara:strand:- start:1333 stop:1611 length:279 start_codon:yes stop_codon:yes gene_type:complete